MIRSLFYFACILCLVLHLSCGTTQATEPEHFVQIEWTQLLKGVDEQNVKIYGFVVPLETDAENKLSEFLLVPYFGACIHVPPPPPNQVIHVQLLTPTADVQTMDTVWVYGKLIVEKDAVTASYLMQDAQVVLAQQSVWQQNLWAVLLTLLCGSSVCLGWIGPFTKMQISAKFSCLSMAFAAGLLLCLGFTAFFVNCSQTTCYLFLLGLLLPLILWKINLRCGLAPAIALHNYPECVLVYSTAMTNLKIGLLLAVAMLAHNAPLGISLGLASKQTSPARNWLAAFIAGILPPLAAIATYWSLRTFVSTESMRLLMTGAGGALVSFALFELLPHALRQKNKLYAISGCLSGVAFMLVSLFYFLK